MTVIVSVPFSVSMVTTIFVTLVRVRQDYLHAT